MLLPPPDWWPLGSSSRPAHGFPTVAAAAMSPETRRQTPDLQLFLASVQPLHASAARGYFFFGGGLYTPTTMAWSRS